MCGEKRPSRPLAGDSFDLLYCSFAGRLRGQGERGTRAYLKSRLDGQRWRMRDDVLCLHDRLALRVEEGDVLGGQLKSSPGRHGDASETRSPKHVQSQEQRAPG